PLTARQHQHELLTHAAHLRTAPGPFQVRSRSESPPRSAGELSTAKGQLSETVRDCDTQRFCLSGSADLGCLLPPLSQAEMYATSPPIQVVSRRSGLRILSSSRCF